MDEFLKQFILEGRELVQQAFDDLLGLERTGHDRARIDGAFRAIHTLKGSAGLFDFAPLGAALHAAEDLMTAVRASGSADDAQAIAALLDCMGATEAWIETVAATERLPEDAAAQSSTLVEALRAALDTKRNAPGLKEGALTEKVPAGRPDPPPAWLLALLPSDHAGAAHAALRYEPNADCFFLGDDPLSLLRSVPSLLAVQIAPRQHWSVTDFDPFRCDLVITALTAAPVAALREVFRLVPDQVTILPATARALVAEAEALEPRSVPGPAARTLRVEASRVDALADLVGELSIAQNRLAYLAAGTALAAPELARSLMANHATIEGLVGAMYRSVMSLRMVPLDQSLRRLPRLVRETASRLGKEVRFVVEGAGVQADKATVDGLFEPLLHVLRNAVDHGIEPAAARVAAGKPADGRITLRAELHGEQIVITVLDDGAGIDPATLRRTALKRRLHDQAALDRMDDSAVLDLIFVPGFSTAAAVTDVSGRGVGMDAVRSALHGMGGEVGIASAPNRGTTIRMAVPQAAFVTTIVIVTLGDERFGIPIDLIVETARVTRAAVMPVAAGAAFVLRDRTIPLLRLADLLGRPAPHSGGDAKIVVITSGGGPVGIEVDGFAARMDVLLRPLHGLLAGLPGVRGSALLGDGQVLLVLDLGSFVA